MTIDNFSMVPYTVFYKQQKSQNSTLNAETQEIYQSELYNVTQKGKRLSCNLASKSSSIYKLLTIAMQKEQKSLQTKHNLNNKKSQIKLIPAIWAEELQVVLWASRHLAVIIQSIKDISKST